MNTHLARVAIASLLLLAGSASRAQDQYPQYGTYAAKDGFQLGQSLVVVNWEIAAPIYGFHNYISDWSLRGFSVEGRRMIRPKISLGGSFSWNRWSQTYNNLSIPVSGGANAGISNGVLSGPIYRYADMFALRALAHYYLMEGPIQPYVGVGIGGVWGYSYQQVVDLTTAQNGFYFIIDPEVGALIQVAKSGTSSFNLNLALRYTFTTVDMGRVTGDAQTFSIIAGIAWAY